MGLLLPVLVLVAYLSTDLAVHNYNFEDTAAAKGLKIIGGYEYFEHVLHFFTSHLQKAKKWGFEEGPTVLNTTYEYTKPIVKLTYELGAITFQGVRNIWTNTANYLRKNYPFAENWYYYYIILYMLPLPMASVIQSVSIIWSLHALVESGIVAQKLPVVKQTLHDSYDLAKDGAIVVFEGAKNLGNVTATYLSTSVFVGSMSPENLQKTVVNAVSNAQVYASSTFSWVYQKIESLTKS